MDLLRRYRSGSVTETIWPTRNPHGWRGVSLLLTFCRSIQEGEMAHTPSTPDRRRHTEFDDLRRLAGLAVVSGAFAIVAAVILGLI